MSGEGGGGGDGKFKNKKRNTSELLASDNPPQRSTLDSRPQTVPLTFTQSEKPSTTFGNEQLRVQRPPDRAGATSSWHSRARPRPCHRCRLTSDGVSLRSGALWVKTISAVNRQHKRGHILTLSRRPDVSGRDT